MKPKIDDSQFKQIVAESYSVRQCLVKQNLKPCGGNYRTFYIRAERLKLDLSHFTGQGHLKGKKNKHVPEISVEDAFVRNGTLQTTLLKNKILKYNLKPYVCEAENCTIEGFWLGNEISLHLDHINGDNRDNRLENLRFLCPNCHSQTSTYCGKSKGKFNQS